MVLKGVVFPDFERILDLGILLTCQVLAQNKFREIHLNAFSIFFKLLVLFLSVYEHRCLHMLEAGHGIPPELKLHAHVSCLACVREVNPPQEHSVLLTTKLSLQAPAVKTLSKY